MNSAGRVTDASGSESPMRWSIVILVVLLVVDALVSRPHVRADHRRGERFESLAGSHRRRPSRSTATRQPMPTSATACFGAT